MQTTVIIQAGNPYDLKDALDALITGGATIVLVTETVKSFYLVVYS